MSTISEKLNPSKADNAGANTTKPSIVKIGAVLACVAAAVFFGRWFLFTPSAAGAAADIAAAAAVDAAEPVQFITVTLTPVGVDTPVGMMATTPEPVIIIVTAPPIVIEPSATPVPTVQSEVVYVPYETFVDRVITNTVTIEVYPSPTPVLAQGSARICVYLEGATALYVGGVGVEGNRCFDYPTVRTVEDIAIRITR